MKKIKNKMVSVASKLFISLTLLLSLTVNGLFLAPVSVQAEGTVLYVNTSATGNKDGSSWKDAFVDLQSALNTASEGNEIWVAEGTYYPSQDINGNAAPGDSRTKTFQMKNELKILGGFPANDESAGIEDRNVLEHQTILSGDLNRNNSIDSSDAYHVFYHPQGTFLNPTAVLDGVTVTGGNANNYSVTDGSNGGGIFNNRSHPKFINVVIENNSAQDSGGGIFNQSSNLVFDGGNVKDNTAGHGAGIYNQQGNLTLSNLTTENNAAKYNGGGLYSSGGKSSLENVLIKNNKAIHTGGGILTYDTEMNLKSVKLIENKARDAAGIFNGGSKLTILGGEISSNIANGGSGGGIYSTAWDANIKDVSIFSNAADTGGGVYIERGNPAFTNVKIDHNTAKSGAGVSVMGGSPKVKDSEITKNAASENGGGLFLNIGSIELANTTIDANTAKNGGGLYSTEGIIKLVNGEIKGNQATTNGGGIYNYNSTMNLTNVLISGNAALSGGGIYSNYVNDSKLLNVTLADNKAAKGGGIYNSASNPVIQNSIIWGNANSIHNSGSAPSFAYSSVQGSGGSAAWETSFGQDLGNNLDQDPKFEEGKESDTAPLTTGNYRLVLNSIAIDQGNNEFVPADVVKDLDNNYRKMGESVDLGAYEKVAPDTEIPSWPQNTRLNVYSATSNSFQLNWMPAKDNYGIAGYKIFINGQLINELKQSDISGNYSIEYLATELKSDTLYRFSVIAYDESGNESKEITAERRTEREPDSQSPEWSLEADLIFTENPSTGVEVEWPAASDNQEVGHYVISVDGVEIGGYGGDIFKWNLRDLKPDTNYEISVKAIDHQGNVSEPLNKAYTTLPVWQEGAELQIAESDFGPQLTVPSTGSGLVNSYELMINGVESHRIYLPETTTYLHNLLPDTEHDITVNAIDSSGRKLAVLNTKYKTLPIWNDDAKLDFSKITQTGFSVNWPKVTSALPVNIEVLVDGQRWNTGAEQYQSDYIFGLEPGTEYEVTVKVLTWEGTVLKELVDKVKTAPYSDEEPPYWNPEQELKVTEIKATSMKVIWPKATDNESVKGYRVLVDNQQVADVESGTTEYSIVGLTKGTTYTLIVQAYDEKGNTGFIRIGVQTDSSNPNGGGGHVIILPPTPQQPVGTISPPRAQPEKTIVPEKKLKDIQGHWAKEYIIEGTQKKIVNGYEDNTFKPDKQINRAEFTILLANALGLTGEGKKLDFSDNKKIGKSARSAIERAMEARLVQGFNDGSFRPSQNITRIEMAAMIARAMKLEGNSKADTGFVDDGSIPSWARGSIGAMKETGIITGRSDNKFEPAVNATRAETIVMLLRMVKYQEKQK